LFQKNDFILLLVIFTSMGAGIGFPTVGRYFSPYTLHLIMVLLFFSFLKIDFSEVFRHVRETASILFVFCLFKLLIVPILFFYLIHAIWSDYALAVLLLSGISTGVVAPFISGLVGASTSLVLIMVVISSLLAPFTLPALVKLLAGRAMEISFLAMVKVLITVVFIPGVGAILLRRLSSSFSEKLGKVQFPASLAMFTFTNLGVFSKYSSFFTEKPLVLAEVIAMAIILSAVYHLIGYGVTWGRKREDRLAGAICFAYMNNVLVIVFASEFFGPLESTLAVIYMLPFFGMIVPARIAGERIR
jgi:bile acid:Na+ symporter, BASS family